jgi:hypothetical protein
MSLQIKVGSIAGVGVALNIPLGFKHKYLKVYNNNDAGSLWAAFEHWFGMADASALKTLKQIDSGSTGLSSQAKVTSNGITPWNGVVPGAAHLPGTANSVAVTAASAVITGTSTQFLNGEIAVGDLVSVAGQVKKVVTLTDATHITCDSVFDTSATAQPLVLLSGKSAGFTLGADADLNAAGEVAFYIAIGD